jgi:hypothetical protein
MFKKPSFLVLLGACALFGAGCAPLTREPIVSDQVNATSSVPVTMLPEADFVSGLMAGGGPWREYSDQDTGVALHSDKATGASFRYPEGFFQSGNMYGEQRSGMGYEILTKPTTPENGTCDGLGDIDCAIEAWPKRYANFRAALQGARYTFVGYEAIPVAQRVRTINGMAFVMTISQGVNGACTLAYARATVLSYANFSVNICDDAALKTEKWAGNTVDSEEKRKAQDILAGKNVSDSTKRKIEAMERVIATLKMK